MNRKKIVLIGAGSAVFTQGLIADFIQNDKFEPWEIALVDTDPRALESITLLSNKMVNKKNADILISSSTERCDALPGADVVVTTIAVGGRRAWENDVWIPRNYGIYQPVGDTTMPGGISRALRMIPPMLDIARDFKKFCPDAYFFNYSNPMTAICAAIREHVNIPVIGLCHGVIHVEHYLADYLGGRSKPVRSLGVGLNHLTFLYDLRVDGKDVFPDLKEKLNQQKKKWQNDGQLTDADNPFSWQVFERYGVFPAVLDRHVVEFFPERFASGEYYGRTLGVDAFSIEKVIAQGDKVYKDMHEQAKGIQEMDNRLFERAPGEHEQLIDILNSLYHDQRKVFSVNIPNNGAVPNLPEKAVLELPAVAAGRGFYPMHLSDFPELPASLIRKRLSVVDLTVKSAVTGDKGLFIEALLMDGSVKDESTAEKLADDLLKAHCDYLPQFFSNSMK